MGCISSSTQSDSGSDYYITVTGNILSIVCMSGIHVYLIEVVHMFILMTTLCYSHFSIAPSPRRGGGPHSRSTDEQSANIRMPEMQENSGYQRYS